MVADAVRIARAEWTRHCRAFGRPLRDRPVLAVLTVAAGLVLGWLAYALGRDLAAGSPRPVDGLTLAATLAFGVLVWRSATYTQRRFERLNSDFLLTAVPTRAAGLGLLGFVGVRLTVSIAIPAIAIAVGLGIGLRSPVAGLSVLVAMAVMVLLAVVVGTTGRLGARLVGMTLVRARFYRDLLIVFGWLPLMAGAFLIQETAVSLQPLFAFLGAVPVAWFVDLALLGGVVTEAISLRRAVGIIVLTAVSAPLLATGTITLSRRIWERTPTGATGTHGSHSLTATGVGERLLGDRISRPTYTVARARWLMERRVPRGLLSSGYALLFMGVIGFPVVAIAGGAELLLLFFAVTLGLAAGIAFGGDPIGAEYRVLAMLFTSVDGRQFVGGLLLAALTVGVPLVAVGIVPLGVIGPIGVPATLLVSLVGIAACASTAAVAAAVGMGIDRFEFGPIPFFFTDVPIYATVGLRGFLHLGLIFGVVGLACLPAVLGNAPPVYGAVADAGVPTVATQFASLVGTVVLLVAIAVYASRLAVGRYRRYRLG